jgi:hypothetical protein
MQSVLWTTAGAAASLTGLALALYTLKRRQFRRRDRWLQRALLCNPGLSGVTGGISVLAASLRHDEAAMVAGLVAVGFFAIGVLFTIAHGLVARSVETQARPLREQ